MDDGQTVCGIGIIFGGTDQQKQMTDRPLNHFLVVTPHVLVKKAADEQYSQTPLTLCLSRTTTPTTALYGKLSI
eukprot:jgi/Psemu1/45272/gm1.45272_g